MTPRPPLPLGDPIRILGAGPSGLSAAIVLARAGRHVVVHDRRTRVGGRFHDDYQGLENWSTDRDVLGDLTQAGVRPDFECEAIHGGTIYNTRLRAAVIRSARPLVYLVRRGGQPGSLDCALAEQAQQAGAELRLGSAIPVEEATIVAGGPRRPRAIAAGINFQTDAADTVSAIVRDSLAPRGYTYLLVGSSHATLATVLYADFKRAREYLRRSVDTYVRLQGLRIAAPVEWGGYADFQVPRSAIRDGRLYVGEAAGFQDFLFGFGIRMAMLSGVLAAVSILRQVDYDMLWRGRFLKMLVSSRVNRLAYSALRSLAYDLLWLALARSDRPERVMRLLYTWWPALPLRPS